MRPRKPRRSVEEILCDPTIDERRRAVIREVVLPVSDRLAEFERKLTEFEAAVPHAARKPASSARPEWDEHIRYIVNAAPPLTEAQRARIAVLFSLPQGTAMTLAATQRSRFQEQRRVEHDKDVQAAKRTLSRRHRSSSAQGIAAELAKRIEQLRTNGPDQAEREVVAEALDIMRTLDVSWAEAYANARGIQESRRLNLGAQL